MITLSIAIPTYNRAPFLEETLATILPQCITHSVEVVISDNGSTDDTLARLKKYEKVRVVGFSTNQGIDHNIVNVIEHSRGEYIQLFADDDLLMPGAIEAILEEIKRTAPLVMCLNHFTFKHPSFKHKLPPFLPCTRKEFHSGSAFFKYCGLGFLSSLILKRAEALLFLQHVRFGKECAHLDIASRIVLKERGLFVCMGQVLVAGRALEKPRYDLIHSCVLYIKELYDELLQEGLLPVALHTFFIRRLMYKEVPRILYKLSKTSSIDLKTLQELKKCFSKAQGARVLCVVLDYRESKSVRLLFQLAWTLLRLMRQIRLKILNKSGTWDPICRRHR